MHALDNRVICREKSIARSMRDSEVGDDVEIHVGSNLRRAIVEEVALTQNLA